MLFRRKRPVRKPDLKSLHKLPIEAQRKYWVDEFKKTEIASRLRDDNLRLLLDANDLHHMVNLKPGEKKKLKKDIEHNVRILTLQYVDTLKEFAKKGGASKAVLRGFERSINEIAHG